MKGHVIDYKAHTVVCKEGDPSTDLYFLLEGKLLICTVSGTQVKALSRISAGEFVGELSFFDEKPRASHIVTLEDSQIVTFSKSELFQYLPLWHQEIHKNITKKIRLLDEIIHQNSIRKSGNEEQKPLSIEEQRKIFGLLSQ